MQQATSGHRVLVIGLDPFRVPGPWDPHPVADAIERGLAGLVEAGYDAKRCLVGTDGSEDVAASVTRALAAEHWDCVLVGGGLRRSDDLELFETVVNLVHRLAPGAAIAFNHQPDQLAVAVARVGVEP